MVTQIRQRHIHSLVYPERVLYHSMSSQIKKHLFSKDTNKQQSEYSINKKKRSLKIIKDNHCLFDLPSTLYNMTALKDISSLIDTTSILNFPMDPIVKIESNQSEMITDTHGHACKDEQHRIGLKENYVENTSIRHPLLTSTLPIILNDTSKRYSSFVKDAYLIAARHSSVETQSIIDHDTVPSLNNQHPQQNNMAQHRCQSEDVYEDFPTTYSSLSGLMENILNNCSNNTVKYPKTHQRVSDAFIERTQNQVDLQYINEIQNPPCSLLLNQSNKKRDRATLLSVNHVDCIQSKKKKKNRNNHHTLHIIPTVRLSIVPIDHSIMTHQCVSCKNSIESYHEHQCHCQGVMYNFKTNVHLQKTCLLHILWTLYYTYPSSFTTIHYQWHWLRILNSTTLNDLSTYDAMFSPLLPYLLQTSCHHHTSSKMSPHASKTGLITNSFNHLNFYSPTNNDHWDNTCFNMTHLKHHVLSVNQTFSSVPSSRHSHQEHNLLYSCIHDLFQTEHDMDRHYNYRYIFNLSHIPVEITIRVLSDLQCLFLGLCKGSTQTNFLKKYQYIAHLKHTIHDMWRSPLLTASSIGDYSLLHSLPLTSYTSSSFDVNYDLNQSDQDNKSSMSVDDQTTCHLSFMEDLFSISVNEMNQIEQYFITKYRESMDFLSNPSTNDTIGSYQTYPNHTISSMKSTMSQLHEYHPTVIDSSQIHPVTTDSFVPLTPRDSFSSSTSGIRDYASSHYGDSDSNRSHTAFEPLNLPLATLNTCLSKESLKLSSYPLLSKQSISHTMTDQSLLSFNETPQRQSSAIQDEYSERLTLIEWAVRRGIWCLTPTPRLPLHISPHLLACAFYKFGTCSNFNRSIGSLDVCLPLTTDQQSPRLSLYSNTYNESDVQKVTPFEYPSNCSHDVLHTASNDTNPDHITHLSCETVTSDVTAMKSQNTHVPIINDCFNKQDHNIINDRHQVHPIVCSTSCHNDSLSVTHRQQDVNTSMNDKRKRKTKKDTQLSLIEQHPIASTSKNKIISHFYSSNKHSLSLNPLSSQLTSNLSVQGNDHTDHSHQTPQSVILHHSLPGVVVPTPLRLVSSINPSDCSNSRQSSQCLSSPPYNGTGRMTRKKRSESLKMTSPNTITRMSVTNPSKISDCGSSNEHNTIQVRSQRHVVHPVCNSNQFKSLNPSPILNLSSTILPSKSKSVVESVLNELILVDETVSSKSVSSVKVKKKMIKSTNQKRLHTEQSIQAQ